MLRAFFSSATGMRAQELMIDNTANNLANVNTTGFKRSYLNFADTLYATHRPPGTEVTVGQQSPTGLQIGSGVRPVGTTRVFSQGVLDPTGNVTDVAIEGEGFFRVLVGGEERYTRDGTFRLNSERTLVTSDGHALEDSITIPAGIPLDHVAIGIDGTVTASQGDTSIQLGQIQLHKFPNPAGLSSVGGNLYRPTSASGAAESGIPGAEGTGLGFVRQGFLEKSNVEVVTELVSLITAQRAYEINSRAIRAGDEMLSNTSQIVR
jgi:flagellar basal-body rod protein FlgG